MTKTPAIVLTEAADLIEQQGWIKGDYYAEGCFCADGAIQVASGYAFIDSETDELEHTEVMLYATERNPIRDLYYQAYHAASAAAETTGFGQRSIIGFNDDFANDKSEVVAVLRQAALTV